MTSTVKALLVALLCVAVAPSQASAQGRTAESLVRRIDSLERRIADLERRLVQLESPAISEPQRTRSEAGNPRDIANWRRLRERMSYDEVRAILGEPERVDGGSVAFWHYPSNGTVTFISGRVTGWTEPSRN